MLGAKTQTTTATENLFFLSLFRPSCEHSVFIAAVVVIIGCFDMIWHFSRGAASPSGHMPGRAECHYVENGCCCELPPSRGISLCKCWAQWTPSLNDSGWAGFWQRPASPTLCYKTECPCNGCSGEVEMRAGGWERVMSERHRRHWRRGGEECEPNRQKDKHGPN